MSAPGRAPEEGGPFIFLQRLTAAFLLLVVIALGWIVLAAYVPDWAEMVSVEAGVLIVLGLLTAALVLVSVVALKSG
jgi:hypothetical protein